jgi:GAF domain-containing protein/anti-sigma regulatory factor (Ser/Thr protein kinase)
MKGKERPMGRGAKPAKAKVKAEPPIARRSRKSVGSGAHDLEKRLAEALKDKAEALEQQTATAEILRVISNLPSDYQPVFDTIVRSAGVVCGAADAILWIGDGDELVVHAHHGPLPARIGAKQPIRGSVAGYAVREARVIHIEDVTESDDFPVGRDVARRLGWRTVLSAPLLRGGLPIGAILIRRREVRPFTESQIKLLETFADQAVIAIENVRLFRELETRNRDLTTALDRQTATAEILSVISRSPTDVRPVFETILERAATLCEAQLAHLWLYEGGEQFRLGAGYGSRQDHLQWLEQGLHRIGRPFFRESGPWRVGQVLDVRDTEPYRRGEALWIRTVDHEGMRTLLGVPLVKDGRLVGSIAIYRRQVRPFTDAQVALVRTFADQAVIAIENVRLFTELRTSNRDLTKALDTQTATSDILRVISRSQTDVQPVFDAIVESAVRLLHAYYGAMTRVVGDRLERVAVWSTTATEDPTRAAWPQPLHGESMHAKAIRDGAPVNIADALTEPGVSDALRAAARAIGYRSLVAVPLLRHDEAIGTIAVTRREPGGFTDDEIALLKTFADQAVIAIENVRLFRELETRNTNLTDALARQTATSEILRVISSSPTDLTPVLDAVARNAARLCEVDDLAIAILRAEGDGWTIMFSLGPDDAFRGRHLPMARTAMGRAMAQHRTVHIPDLLADPDLEVRPEFQAFGWRTGLVVPLLREGVAFGAISARRKEVRPFTDAQIALLETFADQAVIAIENVRLFTETKEALEQQTATGEILRVISGSPTDVQPVFDTIVRSAATLCHADVTAVFLTEGRMVSVPANYGSSPEALGAVRARFPRPLDMESSGGIAILTRSVVHVPDSEEPTVSEEVRQAGRRLGFRSLITVPMLRESEAVGAIGVYRREPGRFSDAEVALLQTFADQAVIAIENVRLFTELQQKNEALTQAHAQVSEALEQQTATSEILRVISRSQTDVQPVFDTIVKSAARLCDGVFGTLVRFDGELLRLVATHNFTPTALDVAHRIWPAAPSRATVMGRAVLERSVIHVPDVELDREYGHPELPRAAGWRSALAVPMLRDGVPLGAIAVGRAEAGPFSDNQTALLQTFADQAVIAIENVRLFTELQASNRELTTALDTQTATSDILRVISRSQTDVQPVFDAIVRSAVRLLGGHSGLLTRVVGEQRELGAFMSTDPAAAGVLTATYPRPLNSPGAHGQAIRDRAPVNILDIHTDLRLTEAGREDARVLGYRSQVVVPLLRQDEAIGALAVTRREPGGFTADEIALLQTFADQAVIAIENARLLTELRARTQELTRSVKQLTALGEVGRAVSSTLDLETVLTTIVSRAVELSGLDGGVVFEYDGGAEEFVQRAMTQTGDALAVARRTTRVRKGEGVLGRTAITLEPIQVADIAVPGAYEGRLKEILIDSGIRAILAVPMVREGRLIGCLGVTRNRPGDFPAETIELLRTFATQSALAIQNARLFHELADKSRQLEAASQHKSEFLANMSHELRTPLNAIIGFSEVLAERMFGEVNAKQAEYLQDILESGRHLLSLINDILDLSKIEAGRMELEPADFDLPSAIDNALILVRERATRRGITLGRHIDEHLGLIQGDERKVKQVLLNLLSNALKFTPEGGRIDVRAALREGRAEVSVADTGVGIASEDQAAVFEEFRQVGTADKKVEGTGLGLALSKKFVELHGGRIWVKSEPGRGATFTFTLPVS